MTIRRDKPNAPPPFYDQRWEYWFWDYVNQNLGTGTFSTFASLPLLAAAGDALGTTTTGTLTMALSTTGVTAGTYGGTAGVPRFDISAAGRMISATNIALEVQDPVLLTKGAGTLQISHNTSGVAAGTYGTGGTMVAQVTVDAKGHVSAVSNVGITFPAAGGGTSTATFTGAVVGTGTIPGGPTGFTFTPNPNFTGTGTTVGWLWTGTATGAMVSLGTATGGYAAWGTGSAALLQGTNMVLSGTGTAVGMLMSGTSTGAMFSWGTGTGGFIAVGTGTAALWVGTSTGGFSRWGTASAGLWQGVDMVLAGTGTAVGMLVSGTSTGAMYSWGTGTGGFLRVGTGTAGLWDGTSTGGFSRWGTGSASQWLMGTGSGGLVSATSVQALMGSAAGSFGRVLVGMQSIVGSTRTTQGTFTYAVATAPTNAIKGTGNGIRMALWGTWNVKPDLMFWVIGTGTVTFSPPAPGIGSLRWSTELNLFSLTDTTQTYLAYYIGAGGTTANQDIQSGTLALATGSAFRMHFAGTQSTAAGTSVCHGGVIDFRNGP